MNRKELVALLNGGGLASHMTEVAKALLAGALNSLVGAAQEPPHPDETKRYDNFLLNSVGPAVSAAAVNYAITVCKKQGYFQNTQFNGSVSHNVHLIQNGTDLECGGWSTALRQFLIPRFGYLDFDSMVDPRHQINHECGYPGHISISMYRHMYDRDDMARRVNDIYADETFAIDPVIYDDEDEKVTTPFEKRWQELTEDYSVLQSLYRLDKGCGIGHFGALLIGLDDGKPMNEPVDEPDLIAGKRKSIGRKKRDILYLRPFDEYLSYIQAYETDESSPRCGLPLYYNLVFSDMSNDGYGISPATGTNTMKQVHWTRIHHLADNLLTSNVLGIPRTKPIFDRLLDLRKIKGGSAEMFWKGAFPGISFEIDPRFAADEIEFDEEKLKRDIDAYARGLDRYLKLLGVSAKSLAPQVADPDKHVFVQLQAIAAHFGVPLRIFLGSEEAKLAASEDKLTWNRRLHRKIKMHTDPNNIRAFIWRLIALGVMPPPKDNRFACDWNDLNTTTDEDKANLALKWTQALSQYVSTGVVHLIQPVDYLTLILGLRPSDALRIVGYMESTGGFAKLKEVDPSQGAGVNGVRKDTASSAGSGTSGGRTSQPSTADKQASGMKG